MLNILYSFFWVPFLCFYIFLMYFLFKNFIFTEVQLIYSVVSISSIQLVTQSYIYVHSFPHPVFHHVLSQDTVYSTLSSSLCTVGPHAYPF